MSPRARQYHSIMSSTPPPPPRAITPPPTPPKKNYLSWFHVYFRFYNTRELGMSKIGQMEVDFPHFFPYSETILEKIFVDFQKYIFKMYKYLKSTRSVALNPPPPRTMLINVRGVGTGGGARGATPFIDHLSNSYQSRTTWLILKESWNVNTKPCAILNLLRIEIQQMGKTKCCPSFG